MDAPQSNESFVGAEPFLWNRLEIAAMVEQADAIGSGSRVTQQKCADEVGVPRTTLQNWKRNRQQLDRDSQLSAVEVCFFSIHPKGSSSYIGYLRPSILCLVNRTTQAFEVLAGSLN